MIRKNGKDKRFRVFLSYAYADHVHARRVRNLLVLADVVVVSPDALAAGKEWLSVIPDEISRCDMFLVVVSPDFLDSQSVLMELGAAWALRKPVIALATQPDITTIPGAPAPVDVIYIGEIEKPGALRDLLKRFRKAETKQTRRKPAGLRKTVRSKEAV